MQKRELNLLYNFNECGSTVTFVSISKVSEEQNWIEFIMNAVNCEHMAKWSDLGLWTERHPARCVSYVILVAVGKQIYAVTQLTIISDSVLTRN